MANEIEQIFISSTYQDLKIHRQAVIKTLQTIGQRFYAMEYFYAAPNTSKQECLERVAASGIFILILGMRYGSIDPETKKSYTQLEYEMAVKTKRPVLAYLIDEVNQPVPPVNMDIGEAAEKLREFKNTVTKNHNCAFFTTEDDLAKKVQESLNSELQKQKFGIKSKHLQPDTKNTRTSWRGYQGLFQLDRYFAAYIPIINMPKEQSPVVELSYDDVDINVDALPYKLHQDFVSDSHDSDSYDKVHDGKSCRLSSYRFTEKKLELSISETRYRDYLKSGEHLDKPYPKDLDRTYRDVFGNKLYSKSADFTLFNLTNICGCGLFILTADNKLLITKHPENSRVYPGRQTYSASGTMSFGDYPNPFTEILVKTREEIHHQVDMKNLRMIGFGADARTLYFQFSFVEQVGSTSADLTKLHSGLIPINFHPEAVVEELKESLWEPAAEATLLTLLIRKYGYRAVTELIEGYRWGRRDIKDEWDYRATCGGIASTLSLRYPKARIPDISKQYIADILEFMKTDVAGKDILEIGSGDGRVTRELIRSGAAAVTCVDICERMINKSKSALESYCDKIVYHNIFAQDYKRRDTHDIAVMSLVLIHNVDDSDFRQLIENACRHARTVYVFEDVTKDRQTSPYTKLRPKEDIIDAFKANGFVDVAEELHSLWEDNIIFIKFVPDVGRK